MAMVVVDDSSLYRRTHSPSQALFFIHQMNRVNSRNDLVVMMTAL